MKEFVVFCSLLFAVASCRSSEKSQSVIATINAQWNSTSLLAEASEFVGKGSPKDYWTFVTRVVTAAAFRSTPLTDKEKYELALNRSASMLDPTQTKMLKLSLAVRLNSPVVKLFQDLGSKYKHVACSAFYVVNGKTMCSKEELEYFRNQTRASKRTFTESSLEEDVLPMDHPYPGPTDRQTLGTVFLYGELGKPEFRELMLFALGLAKSGEVKLVHRHFSKEPSTRPLSLSGYGIELAIKNTEYTAEDDATDPESVGESDADDVGSHGLDMDDIKTAKDGDSGVGGFQTTLREVDVDDMPSFKQWELQDIGFQAAQQIALSAPEDILTTLKDVSQNFPILARTLSKTLADPEFVDEVEAIRSELTESRLVRHGANGFFINGAKVDVDSLDLFQLIDLVEREMKLAGSLFALGIKNDFVRLLGKLKAFKGHSRYALDYRRAEPMFINDLEEEIRYDPWGDRLESLASAMQTGMFKPIARNLFSVVVVMNPADTRSHYLISLVYILRQNMFPARFGFVFVVSGYERVSGKEDVGVAMLNMFNYFAEDVEDNFLAISKLNELVLTYNESPLTVGNIEEYFVKQKGPDEYERVFGRNSKYNQHRKVGGEFVRKSGLSLVDGPKVLFNGFVLDDDKIGMNVIHETLTREISLISSFILQAMYGGRLTEENNVADWFLEQDYVVPKINKNILDGTLKNARLDIGPKAASNKALPSKLTLAQRGRQVMDSIRYIHVSSLFSPTSPVPQEVDPVPISLWIVADVETIEGRRHVMEALQAARRSSNIRVGVLANLKNDRWKCDENSLSVHVQVIFKFYTQESLEFLDQALEPKTFNGLVKGTTILSDLISRTTGIIMYDFMVRKEAMQKVMCEKVRMQTAYAREVLGLKPGQRGVVANGIVYPMKEGEEWKLEDFQLLEQVLVKGGAEELAQHVDEVLKKERSDAKKRESLSDAPKKRGRVQSAADVILAVSALVTRLDGGRGRTFFEVETDPEVAAELRSVVDIPAQVANKPAMNVIAVVNPLTPSTQKLASMLEMIKEVANVNIKLVLQPTAHISEAPIKRLYRYVAPTTLAFDGDGNVRRSVARFERLPKRQLLAMGVDAPDAWMVEATHAMYDLDNIKLAQVPSNVVAVFSLAHILLEGHCFEAPSGRPPRGLQLVLGTPDEPNRFDTIVMANMGYFQLKANPGVWQLQIRDGTSSETYDVRRFDDNEVAAKPIRVTIVSFSGKTVELEVAKKPGMEHVELLEDDAAKKSGGVMESIKGYFSADEKPRSADEPETINVFSLASGHLYERFLRIMMLSVMKNTRNPVKFWLLNNYLSPQFKAKLPLMAEHYRFDYALVEYKWPSWLRRQTEKQRLMWAYKILFLDVLFPLDVQKVIFVDADQVVRADLLELVHTDLEGAPYGYVPFCDSRTEMDGFRFWKHGYWAELLGSRKYHISALYVIDLKRFRHLAAGDRLRGQYHALSSDPKSLSNLDQDLPNNMIRVVPIKSLPQEWLWCETWCDDASKGDAKTIDLCNNPMTKEPKLKSAARIIDEWSDYDEEIRDVLAAASSSKPNAQHMSSYDRNANHQEL